MNGIFSGMIIIYMNNMYGVLLISHQRVENGKCYKLNLTGTDPSTALINFSTRNFQIKTTELPSSGSTYKVTLESKICNSEKIKLVYKFVTR